MIRTIRSASPHEEVRAILRVQMGEDPETRDLVSAIIREVVSRGDEAVVEYTRRFDRFEGTSMAGLRVGREMMERAADELDPALLEALRAAAANIRAFHERQMDRGFLDLYPDGSVLGQRVTALERVGVYVPGGLAAYPSSVLMNVIPARVAGVESVVMVSPAPDGQLVPAVLAAAWIAGVDEFWCIGGAQAVAALAWGTESIHPVDKIVGPGNRWVAEAKRQVFGRVDIDMIAGPSEILVVADSTAEATHVAADLIAQAEHDRDAIAWLVTDHLPLARAVPDAVAALLEKNPRREIASASLRNNGLIVVVDDLRSAAEVADLRAPEHLELIVREPMQLAGAIRNAGAIFLGAHTPESLGDYYAGPNHVLPTGGTARWASPLGTYEFLKRTSLLGYSAERLASHAADVIRLAEAENLPGHAEAVRVRFSAPAGHDTAADTALNPSTGSTVLS
ncbi:MAG: histidinol dehydrogenase [Gemmatimonadota bacterium]|jgi:histidinol dehydrogenase|nr:histidinol dehydrogenase [Gemmatimonadota bacterium]